MQRWGAAALHPVANGLMLLVLRVVLLAVDPLALAILLAVDLAALLWRELSAVGFALGLDFVMNRSLLLLQARRLSRCEGTILHAFSDRFGWEWSSRPGNLRQHVAHTTQQQSTHHHAHPNAFHVQFPFLLRLSVASGLLNEARPHKVYPGAR